MGDSKIKIGTGNYDDYPWWSKLVFHWLTPTMKHAGCKVLEVADLSELTQWESTSEAYAALEKNWDVVTLQKSTRPLLHALYLSCKKELWITVCLKIVCDIITYATPLMLNSVLTVVDGPTNTRAYAKASAIAAVVLVVESIQIVSFSQYFYLLNRIGLRMHNGILGFIYSKLLSVEMVEATTDGSKNASDIINSISGDTQRIWDSLIYANMIWSAPAQLVFGMLSLYYVIGRAALVCPVIYLILGFITAKTIKSATALQKNVLCARDKRIMLTTDYLMYVKTIRMYGWDDIFKSKIEEARKAEIKVMRSYAIFTTIIHSLWGIAPIVMSVTLLGLYSYLEGKLSVGVAFTIILLVNALRFPLEILPYIASRILEANLSIRRLESNLSKPQLESHQLLDHPSAILLAENATLAWKGGHNFLTNLNFTMAPGELLSIVGATGSGKTGFVSALFLNGATASEGIFGTTGTISYCPQVIWIIHGSLRQNVIFGFPFDEARYNEIVAVTGLSDDVNSFPDRDATILGEKGYRISGGQKQRIGLARCLYMKADLYVLDDVLSALDNSTGDYILKHAILNYLATKSVVLITHNIHVALLADKIMYLKDNRMHYFGSPSDITEIDNFSELYTPPLGGTQTNTPAETTPRKAGLLASKSSDSLMSTSDKESTFKADDTITGEIGMKAREELATTGSVSLKVYNSYCKGLGGYRYLIPCLFLHVLTVSLSTASECWIVYWARLVKRGFTAATVQRGWMVYFLLNITAVFFIWFSRYSTFLVSLRASRYFHESLLTAVVNFSMQFFNNNPIGRVINRFTKDIHRLDDHMDQVICTTTSGLLQMMFTVIIICVVIPFFPFIIIPLFILCHFYQRYFIKANTQLRRIDGAMRSPIYSQFAETFEGVSTIRAFNQESYFQELIARHTDNGMKANILSLATNRWISLRLEAVGRALVFFTTILAIWTKLFGGGMKALVITLATNVADLFPWAMQQMGEAQSNFVCVERIQTYLDDEPQLERKDATVATNEFTLEHGSIQFHEVCLTFSGYSKQCLKNVNFTINPCEKIGIIGRTGAGKSTIINALLRLYEITDGTITIDGVDTKTICVNKLRRSISTIPQDPIVFSGTIRFNIDPQNERTDEQCIVALKDAHLYYHLEKITPNDVLNFRVKQRGGNLSMGQKQLLCLARAILRKSKILLIDEATSTVDNTTDQLVQNTLRTKFKDTTILTIAHRIHTLLDYDKIMVVDNGEVVAFERTSFFLESKSYMSEMLSLSNMGDPN